MPGPTEGRGRSARAPDGWGPYLVLVVALAPVVVPTGPAQMAILDAFNVLALAAFAVAFLTRRIELKAPYVAGVFFILLGSLIAIVNAESVSSSVLALVQDAYLYMWFLLLVTVLSVRGDLVGLRMAWVAFACVEAIVALVIVAQSASSLGGIVGPRGARAMGTFFDPNMCADYLGMSLFVLLSLGDHVGRPLRWAATALLLAAIVATKSNGGALSLFAGLLVYAVVRARTVRFPLPAIAGIALVVVSLVASAWWITSSIGVGTRQLESFRAHSFLARAGHSSEGRLKIWRQLEQTMQKTPLGIGPGNSRWVSLDVQGRERPHSMYSKEAHSDYLAYAIERGPLAILALLFLLGQTFAKLRSVWRRRLRAGSGDRAASALVAGLAGALACSAVHSLTIERLHFRHFWLLLALVCALAEAARVRHAAQAAVAPAAREEAAEPLAAARA